MLRIVILHRKWICWQISDMIQNRKYRQTYIHVEYSILLAFLSVLGICSFVLTKRFENFFNVLFWMIFFWKQSMTLCYCFTNVISKQNIEMHSLRFSFGEFRKLLQNWSLVFAIALKCCQMNLWRCIESSSRLNYQRKILLVFGQYKYRRWHNDFRLYKNEKFRRR